MIHFPATDPEFEEMFKTEEDCMEYIISVRWPEGYICPIYQHDKL
ncbi:MAG: transposase [Deltaproteobacteria bacterium]|nr:transposase [Deltaproteobacteria bacterium]